MTDRPTVPALALCLLLLAAAAPAAADEGMWPPDQLGALDWPALKERGLALGPADLWNDADGGLLRAVVNLEGCSAGFVSPDGLIVTNHHCVYAAIQEHATADRNLIDLGYTATSRAAELPAKNARVLVLERIEDVTSKVKAAADSAGADDLARTRAIERASKELVAACEQEPGYRCSVGADWGGLRYRLHRSREIRDVRLVYAPPDGVGEYGGEVDNWMWPRHTGDFAFVRAYVAPDGRPAPYAAANVPYRPKRWFALSAAGVRPGDLVLVAGYPGRTQRYLPAVAVERDLTWWYPRREEVLGDWIAILEAAAAANPETAVRVAGTVKSLANGHKNAEGMIAGITRNGVLPRRRAEEAELRAWIAADPARAARFAGVLDELDAVYARERAMREKDFLLRLFPRTGVVPAAATTITRWAREQASPDLEREPGYQERDRARLLAALERGQQDLAPAAERQVLADLLRRALELPPDQRIVAVDRLLAPALEPGADRAAVVDGFTERIYAGTKLTDQASRVAMFGMNRRMLAAGGDPAIGLALAFEPERLEMEARDKARDGALARLRPKHAELLIAWRGGRVYPDANSTLRVAFGTVRGYSPREAVTMAPQTTLAGLLAKHTGEAPFDAPAALVEAAGRKDFGPWAQADLASVPVNFLSDSDTTGGNSGSPVLNGKGELVGLNFDRVFENVAGDYGWSPLYSRNVMVDVRFVLWMLDRVAGASPLLAELGIGPPAP
jgi:hypothetical protein